jgi:hypothetical protein
VGLFSRTEFSGYGITVMRQFLKGVKPENTEGCTKPTWETVFCVGVFGGTCLSI